MDTLFAYGTLQHPDIFTAILGRFPPGEPAVLEGYARFLIRGEDYPGIIVQPGARTPGTLFRGISDEEWRRLDKYESDLYVRLEVRVRTPDGAEHSAYAYVIPERHRHHLSDLPWELNQYRPRLLPGHG